MAEVDFDGKNAAAQKEATSSGENPVHVNLDRLERNLATIEAQIHAIGRSLSPVLSPTEPMPIDPNEAARGREQSPLANRIDNMADHAFELGTKLQELTDRLEV